MACQPPKVGGKTFGKTEVVKQKLAEGRLGLAKVNGKGMGEVDACLLSRQSEGSRWTVSLANRHQTGQTTTMAAAHCLHMAEPQSSLTHLTPALAQLRLGWACTTGLQASTSPLVGLFAASEDKWKRGIVSCTWQRLTGLAPSASTLP